MKTTFYIVRHGQSKGNLHDRFVGHTDIGLTEQGYRQAHMAAQYLKGIHADVIYSSDLSRAYDTACATARLKDMDVIKSAQLREINGGAWEGKIFSELDTLYPEDFGCWRENFGYCRCTDGESVLELQQRIVSELKRIAEKNPGKTVMVFCHATPIRVFRAYCENATPEQMSHIPWATNASVTHAEYENGQFRLMEYSIDHFMGNLVTALPSDV